MAEPKDNSGILTGGETPVQRSWATRFASQYAALLRKNVVVSKRNVRALVIQLLSPFLSLCLVLLIDVSLRADAQGDRVYQNELDPKGERVGPVPHCNDDLFINAADCYFFLYAPDSSIHAKSIAENVATKNTEYGGVEIPVERIRGFSTASAIDTYLSANPEITPGAVIFHEELDGNALTRMDFTLQFNSTTKFFKGTFQDPNMFFQMPMQMAVEREIHRYFRQQADLPTDTLEWDFEVKPFSHPALETASFIATYAGAFIFAAAMFNFVFAVTSLVGEREAGLRQALRTVGMLDSAYWLSWATWHLALSFVYALIICVSGYILQMDLFLKNGFGVIFMLLFLFFLSMTSFAYVMSAFVKKSSSATVLGFALFVVGWVMQSVVAFFPYSQDEYDRHGGFWYGFFAAFPWNLLGKSLSDLGSASSTEQSPGIQWSERYSYCVNWKSDDRPPDNPDVYADYSCVISIGDIMEILAIEVFVYFLFAVYLDNVVKNENGLRRPPWYFFMPAYWVAPKGGRSSIQVGAKRSGCFVRQSPPLDEPADLDDDVLAEQSAMKKRFQDRTGLNPDSIDRVGRAPVANISEDGRTPLALEVYGLRKWFGGFQAIKNSWFNVEEGQLFCLLGPNGAGKSTTINCLTGILPPDGGDALIYDESLTAAGGMDRIRSFIGVCPQFDVLWPELTGQEHLEIYGQVKGLPAKQVKREARELLHNVKLLDSSSIRAGSYSGGMKRRLSVAVALLGNPKVVYLDEPTTGMDPITRRHVWDIVEEAKKGRAIILTTHSMEEADILGDRIAIMARGSLRCLGSSLRLKSKFGAGYCISVNVLPGGAKSTTNLDVSGRATRVKEFFKAKLGLEPSDETKAYVQFLIPKEKEDMMPGFLADLKDAGDALGVSDLHVALTSLEEVFLAIARQAEIEADGSGTREVELDDMTVIQVPLGHTTCAHPETGVQYTVKWGQDESGNLQVLYAQRATPAES